MTEWMRLISYLLYSLFSSILKNTTENTGSNFKHPFACARGHCLVYLTKKTVKTIHITWRFFTVFALFCSWTNFCKLFLLTAIKIFVSVSGNFAHVVLLSFGLLFLLWIIKLALILKNYLYASIFLSAIEKILIFCWYFLLFTPLCL